MKLLKSCCTIDAMLSERIYRKAMSVACCRAEIERNIGIMYDPEIAGIILEHWDVFSGSFPYGAEK